MATRLRYNFITGTCSLTATTLTLTATGVLGPNTITSGVNYLPLVINPAPYGATASGEIVYVTGYNPNTTTATVIRGQEGTSGSSSIVWPNNTVYAHGTLAGDFGVASGIAYGDFPAPTASGQWFVSQASGAVNPAWVDTIPTTELSGTIAASGVVGLLTNATISGQNVVSNINATQISGGLVQSSVQISGSQVVSNINATQISGGALQSSVTISGAKVYGDLSNSTISGSRVYGNISANATISGAQVVGNILATQVSGGALAPSTTISGSQVYGTLSANTTISGARVYGDLSNSTISGARVKGNILATQISGGALQSSVTISGSTITNAVVSGNIDASYGFINYGQYTYPVLTGPGLIDGHHSGTTWIDGIVNVFTVISGVSESNVVISGRNILASAISGTIGNNTTISGSQVYGALLNSTTISGSQIRGDIPAAQISGFLSETSVGMYAGSMYTAGLNAGLVLTSNGYSAGWGTAAYSYVYALDDVTVTVTGVNGKKLLGTGGTPGVGAYNTWNVDVNIYSSGGSAPTNTKDCAMYVQAIASGLTLGVVGTQAQICAWLPAGTRGMGSTSFQFDNLDPNESYEFHLYAYTWTLTGAVPISLAFGRAKVTGTYQ